MKSMWLLWLFVVLPTVFGQYGFGKSYLRDSRLCRQWNCINTKLGFEDSLPPKHQTVAVLQQLLPQGPWQDVVENVVQNCYENRTRRFTNTCPGQALMHCLVDQMIDFCPVTSLRKDDSCSLVTSISGLKFMFSQSRYMDLEKNLPRERRPTWFLKNIFQQYFDKNCCDLPVIFNSTVLEECGFSSVINYVDHGPKHPYLPTELPTPTIWSTTPPSPITTPDTGDTLKIVDLATVQPNSAITDPMECCDMEDFIKTSWKSECDFHLQWGGKERLVISQAPATEPPTTTTERTEAVQDIMLVPQSCEKETCVFQNLGIIKETGFNTMAYVEMLTNFTHSHQAWTHSIEKVVSRCLDDNRQYGSECLINDILACTFDVLTENCPYKRKSGICKHGKHEVPCQISSSKYRPKNRREICLLPELVHHDHLYECGLDAIYKVERVAMPVRHKKQAFTEKWYKCKDSKTQTSCMMDKMGILNKYKFMDYFRMKDRIRQFTVDKPEWSAMLDIYMSAYINLPMYADHCNSEKKLLNVIDAMLMTCPVSKRKNTPQCNSIFSEMIKETPADNQNVTKEKLDEIMKHYHHVFMPTPPKFDVAIRKKQSKHIKPAYQLGILGSKNAPSVRVAYVPSKVRIVRPPLILRPVYLRPSFIQGRVSDGIFRNNPFWLHDQLAKPLKPTTVSTITSTSTTEVSNSSSFEVTTKPSDPLIDLPNENNLDLGRPE